MTQGELSQLIKEKETKIINQSEKIAVLQNAILAFKKQMDTIIDLIKETKTEQNDFDQSVPDDGL